MWHGFWVPPSLQFTDFPNLSVGRKHQPDLVLLSTALPSRLFLT
jgi:hypothetical protein